MEEACLYGGIWDNQGERKGEMENHYYRKNLAIYYRQKELVTLKWFSKSLRKIAFMHTVKMFLPKTLMCNRQKQ